MHILVTGGAGFIGSFLAERLLAVGHQVRILDILDSQVHPQGLPAYISPEVDFRVGDIRDKETCQAALEGVDAVVHCASAVGVAQSLYRVAHYVDVNVRGTAILLECLAEQRPPLQKLVMLTSMTQYGEGLYRRPSDGQLMRVDIRSEEEIRRWGWEPVCQETGEPLEPVPTPEDAALLARNVYALTKRYQEELSLNLSRVYGYAVICLRLFNVYGPRQSLSNPYTGVLAIFLSRLLAGQRPVVYEDGRQTRDFISVHDVVHAVMLVLESSVADGQVLNIGSGVPRPIGEVARTLAHLAGRDDLAPHLTGQYRKGDVRHCYADIHRAQQLLGYSPQVSWEVELKELIEWSRSAFSADRFVQADQELRKRGLLTGAM